MSNRKVLLIISLLSLFLVGGSALIGVGLSNEVRHEREVKQQKVRQAEIVRCSTLPTPCPPLASLKALEEPTPLPVPFLVYRHITSRR